MPEVVNPETHHEKSDVNVRALLLFLVIFIIFAALTHGLLYLEFHFFSNHFSKQQGEPMTEVARPDDAAVPPQPRLQPLETKNLGGRVNPPNTNTPVTDMEQMRAAEEQVLHSAGWVDRQHGIVRIPIEQAKALAVQRMGAHR